MTYVSTPYYVGFPPMAEGNALRCTSVLCIQTDATVSLCFELWEILFTEWLDDDLEVQHVRFVHCSTFFFAQDLPCWSCLKMWENWRRVRGAFPVCRATKHLCGENDNDNMRVSGNVMNDYDNESKKGWV